MRRVLLYLVAVCVLSNAGCFINTYSSDPNRRMVELLNVSEDLRQIELEWERFWFTDQPSHLTPERIPGGIRGHAGRPPAPFVRRRGEHLLEPPRPRARRLVAGVVEGVDRQV